MLTDEEITGIFNQFHISQSDNRTDFARAIERAVLAKAGEQEPQVIGRVHYADDRIYGCLNSIGRELDDGAPLYAHPLPAQAIPEGYTAIKTDVFNWLLGENGDFECPESQYFKDKPAKYFWRTNLRNSALSASTKP